LFGELFVARHVVFLKLHEVLDLSFYYLNYDMQHICVKLIVFQQRHLGTFCGAAASGWCDLLEQTGKMKNA
jgi:hypothetical protein